MTTSAAAVKLMILLFFFEVDVVTRKKVTNKDRNYVHSVLYSNTHTHTVRTVGTLSGTTITIYLA